MPHRPRGWGGWVQNLLKTFLGQVGVWVQILPRFVQEFGFPLALHIPTDKETSIHLYSHLYIYRYWKPIFENIFKFDFLSGKQLLNALLLL